MKVLIAIEPRSYREVIGLAIEELRPHLRVEILEPDLLESEVSRLEPDLVFCSRSDCLPGSCERAWIEFRPYAETQATVCLGGVISTMEGVDLDDILSIVDRAERLLRGPLPSTCEPGARRQLRSTRL